MGGYPLLLTGTINSSVYGNVGNRITDTMIRLSQYENAIKKYIKETPFDPIVFIENSGYEFDSRKYAVMAEKYGKKFEFISGTICVHEITTRGKSYGDAFLIHEALEQSQLLKEFDFFYKITGRIFLKNARKICRTRDKYRNEFIVYTGMGWCLTNIFKANKKDYLKYLDDVYQDCDESKISDIEISFYRRLKKADLQIGSFECYPYFEGIMGATLEPYSGNLAVRLLRNFCARLHIFSFNSKMSKLIKVVMKLKKAKSYE